MLESVAAKWLPKHYLEVSRTGGIFTLIAWAFMCVAFVRELASSLDTSYSTTLTMDLHEGEMLEVNFAITMYGIHCQDLEAAIFAQSSSERISTLEQDFVLRSIDGEGRPYGVAINPTALSEEDAREGGSGEEHHQQEMKKYYAQDGQNQLDSDWASSHDALQHTNFDHVLKAHDFTFINFFAGWCSHCRDFAPIWNDTSTIVNGHDEVPAQVYKDNDGVERRVRLIKVNCVDFQTLCDTRDVDAFPTLRLYKADESYSTFTEERNESSLLQWIGQTVATKSYKWANKPDDLKSGCNAKGRLLVPRVPGHFELKPVQKARDLNPRLVNLSHVVEHLSFNDPNASHSLENDHSVPRDVSNHINPLAGKSFITNKFHQTWIHDLKLVSTLSPRGTVAYQFHHYEGWSKVAEDVIPSVRFDFDLEPFSILIQKESKQWYEFWTAVLAILGGVFVSMRISSRIVLAALAAITPDDGMSMLPTGSGMSRSSPSSRSMLPTGSSRSMLPDVSSMSKSDSSGS